MPRRRLAPDHRAIVNAQQELLKWCPNAEGVSKKGLEYVCWACGARSEERLTRCHIEQYLRERPDQPSNLIILCDRCHQEQPDALPKETLKYWLATRESKTEYDERRAAVFKAAIALLEREFGDLVVKVACEELAGDMESWRERYRSRIERYRQNRSAGQGSGNRHANIEWGWIAEFHAWCVTNKESVELRMQEIERKLEAALEAHRRERARDVQRKDEETGQMQNG